MKSNKKQNIATEDYLETLYELEIENKQLSVTNIAAKLKISKPSVSEMIKKLAKENFVIYEKYKEITLTEKGRKIGKNINHKHTVLEEFFDILNVNKTIQLKNIHGIEHHLDQETIDKIEKLNHYLKELKYKG